MENFIYVFSSEERDILLSKGYTLLKSDDGNKIYVFVNQVMNFELLDVNAVFSNTLTF